MFQILLQCRSIVFDDGVSYAPSAERLVIGISGLVLQEIMPLCHPGQNALEIAAWIQIKQMLSKVIRLREQEPVKVLQSELVIDGRIQEVGLDGFRIGRALNTVVWIENHFVEAASISVPRRRRRAKTDRIDGEMLVRTSGFWRRDRCRLRYVFAGMLTVLNGIGVWRLFRQITYTP
ncbi:hypothetical protein HFO89_34200 [Rhizobium leguminosarum]|nr:hypothetical protein [Rhizobium leguminosarum]